MSEQQENDNQIDQNTKKKQKAGLNAVRPDDTIELKFKSMASEKGVSQTEFFNRIFFSYLRKDNEEKRNDTLNCEGELNIIAKDLDNILLNFKSIAERAQDKITVVTSNADQTRDNLNVEIDTLQKQVELLEKRNLELEKSNGAFEEIKLGYEEKIDQLTKDLSIAEEEIKTFKENAKDNVKTIRELEKQCELDEKEIKSMRLEQKRNLEELNTKESRIHNSEIEIHSYKAAIDNLEMLKKSEFAALEAKNQAVVADLQIRLKAEIDENETRLQRNIEKMKTEMESDNKLALADMKLELAEAKEKLAMFMTKEKE